MVGLAVLGVALTTVDRVLARRYWMWLVPAYGLLCVVTAWYRPRDDESDEQPHVPGRRVTRAHATRDFDRTEHREQDPREYERVH